MMQIFSFWGGGQKLKWLRPINFLKFGAKFFKLSAEFVTLCVMDRMKNMLNVLKMHFKSTG